MNINLTIALRFSTTKGDIAIILLQAKMISQYLSQMPPCLDMWRYPFHPSSLQFLFKTKLYKWACKWLFVWLNGLSLVKQIYCEQKFLHRELHGIRDSGQQMSVTRVSDKTLTLLACGRMSLVYRNTFKGTGALNEGIAKWSEQNI